MKRYQKSVSFEYSLVVFTANKRTYLENADFSWFLL